MIGNSCVQAIAELAYGFLPSYSCHQQSFVPSPSVDSTLSRRRCGHGGAVVVCEKVEHLGSGSALIMMMMCTAVAMQRRHYVHSTHVWIRRKQSKI